MNSRIIQENTMKKSISLGLQIILLSIILPLSSFAGFARFAVPHISSPLLLFIRQIR